MELFFRNKLGSQLALAALAACFFVAPGKAQNTSKGRAETPACTSYPEWYCEPEATPDQQKALAMKRQEKKGSKLHAARKVQERKSNQEVSGAADSLNEGFERRP